MDSTQTPQNQTVESSPKPKKSKAKVVLLVLLGLLLLGGVAYGAYWYGQKMAKDEAGKQISELESKVSDLEKKVEEADGDSEQNDSFLVIEQWGVRVPLSSDINDAVYSIVSSSNDIQQAKLSTASAEKLGEACTVDGSDSLGGVIFRGDANAQIDLNGSGMRQLSTLPDVTELGGYYYYYRQAQQPCSVNNPEEAASLSGEFKKAVKKLQAGE